MINRNWYSLHLISDGTVSTYLYSIKPFNRPAYQDYGLYIHCSYQELLKLKDVRNWYVFNLCGYFIILERVISRAICNEVWQRWHMIRTNIKHIIIIRLNYHIKHFWFFFIETIFKTLTHHMKSCAHINSELILVWLPYLSAGCSSM